MSPKRRPPHSPPAPPHPSPLVLILGFRPPPLARSLNPLADVGIVELGLSDTESSEDPDEYYRKPLIETLPEDLQDRAYKYLANLHEQRELDAFKETLPHKERWRAGVPPRVYSQRTGIADKLNVDVTDSEDDEVRPRPWAPLRCRPPARPPARAW